MQDGQHVTTFLFTDIEGSTRLWEQKPERMRPALARHDVLARSAVESHRGLVVKTTGDGLYAVFGDPLDALHATLALHRALPEVEAELGSAFRVRCGLHAGVVEHRDNDYFGSAVNRAARIMGVAHGGQTVLSHTVASLVSGRLPEPLGLRELGAIRLRDIAEPQRLFQLVHPHVPHEFPPVRALEETPHNLPCEITSFVGRERELRELARLLASERLVTIVGLGGMGKTRLALQAASAALERHRDGAWLVELAALTEPDQVAQAVAGALQVRAEPGESLEQALSRRLRGRTALLLLDNCEHLLVASARLVRQLLGALPGLTVLATSREPLRVAGETQYALSPLGAEAVELFVRRARAARVGFVLAPEDAPHVEAICRRLDGIPLAIELAAARVRSFSVRQLATRLEDRFRLLDTGDPTAAPRQQTLGALIGWSYDLLSPSEQRLLRRLSVFAGGFTLEAVEEVCAGGDEGGDAMHVLGRLVEKSLVWVDVASERYGLLETVRDFAAQRLRASGERDAVRARHAQCYAEFAECTRPHLVGPESGRWMRRVDLELANILAAHAAADEVPGLAAAGLRMVYRLKLYWLNRGLLALGSRLAVEALARPCPEEAAVHRCLAALGVGQFACFRGDYGEAIRWLEESLAVARRIGDDVHVAAALQPLSWALIGRGELAQAETYAREAVARAEALDDRRDLACAWTGLANVLRVSGRLAEARPYYEGAVEAFRESGDREAFATALVNLAMDSLQPAAMRAHASEVLGIAVATDSRPLVQNLLDLCAGIAALEGDAHRAAVFFGASEAQARRMGARRDPADQAFLDPLLAPVRRTLGAGFARAVEEGHGLEGEGAVEALRGWLARPGA